MSRPRRPYCPYLVTRSCPGQAIVTLGRDGGASGGKEAESIGWDHDRTLLRLSE